MAGLKVTRTIDAPKMLRKFAQRKKRNANNGAKMAAEQLLKWSKPLVPVDTGKLKASGEVVKRDTGYAVQYSSANKQGYDYAYIQHENLEYHHEVGQAKYLEQPLREHAQELMDIVAREARRR